MAKKTNVKAVETKAVSMRAYDVIRGPIVTEKSAGQQQAFNQFTVQVAKDANKTEIKLAFEAIFKVKVSGVNIINTNSRERRVGQRVGIVSGIKKAIVTLEEGCTLDIANVA